MAFLIMLAAAFVAGVFLANKVKTPLTNIWTWAKARFGK